MKEQKNCLTGIFEDRHKFRDHFSKDDFFYVSL